MRELRDLFNGVIKKLENEFGTFEYLNERVSMKRVIADREYCVDLIKGIFNRDESRNNIEIAVAMYVNFFIKSGMAGRLQKESLETEFDGLESVLERVDYSDSLKQMCLAIKKQNYDEFAKVLTNNKDSIVARIYLFVKECHAYCKEASEKFDESLLDRYSKMWDIYETLPNEWKEYILGEGSYIQKSDNAAMDNNFLPYMDITPVREYLSKNIGEYYKSILNKLEINPDIKNGNEYTEILKRLGVTNLYDFVGEIPRKIANQEGIDCNVLLQLICNSISKLSMINEDMDATFLLEKIHELQFGRLEYEKWKEGEDYKEPFRMYLASRNSYLHIPVRFPFDRNLFKTQYELLKRNKKIREDSEKKKVMMDYYAHSWKHISYPQIIKEVAEELSKTNISLSNRLVKAYNSEKTLQRGIELLQYSNSDDEATISRVFREGIARTGSDIKGRVPLIDVIADSLDLVVFKILMVESDDSNRMVICRKKMNQYISLERLKEEYIKSFLETVERKENIIEWVNRNLVEIDIDIDDIWRQIRFYEDNFAINQFKELLVEIFTNFFIYGEGSLQMMFKTTENKMLIETSNRYSDSEKWQGSGKGIVTMSRILDAINYGKGIEGVVEHKDDKKYKMRITFSKEILIRRGR